MWPAVGVHEDGQPTRAGHVVARQDHCRADLVGAGPQELNVGHEWDRMAHGCDLACFLAVDDH